MSDAQYTAERLLWEIKCMRVDLLFAIDRLPDIQENNGAKAYIDNAIANADRILGPHS